MLTSLFFVTNVKEMLHNKIQLKHGFAIHGSIIVE